MRRPYILSVLALLGVIVAIIAVINTNRAVSVHSPVAEPVAAPFASFVAGVGITETGRGNVAVGTAVFGVVTDLYVRVGDQVNAGDPLFKIDDRSLRAQLSVARAKVTETEAALARPIHRLEFLTRLQKQDNSAISDQAMSDARDDARAAESVLGSAKAEAAQVEVEIKRCLVRAPAPGRILQINTRVGEYAQVGGQARPLMLLGDDARVYLRVDIDEGDAWRVRPEAQARAYVRGNPQLQATLRFEYIEPYVTPRTSLTGQSTERTDVRVLQVIYSFERSALPVYLGQQMDVFIEAPGAAPADANRQP
jgi:RND family efflux transporter MFP subunit